ncbi:hypothetical protein [Methanobrevibacter cuticularis]|nr:hypothetical protein [Methanobrevibacter cuticularis]
MLIKGYRETGKIMGVGTFAGILVEIKIVKGSPFNVDLNSYG